MTDKGKFCFYCGKPNDDQHQGEHERGPGPLPAPRFYTACGCPLLHHRPNCPKKNTTSSPTPMIVTGSVAFALERDALKADNVRLRRELGAVQRMIAELRNENVWVARHEQLSHENAILLESRTVAQEEVGRLNREIEAAQAELDRMRPVVEAALNLEVYPPYVTSGRSEDKLSVFVRACRAYRNSAGKGGE